MSVVASLLSIPVFASSVLVDVMAGVVRPLIVDEVLLDWGCLPALRGVPSGQKPLSHFALARAFLHGRPSTTGG